jgi:hypothetical protein|tara:strand:- start:4446 stop:4601 length:156 start_codon:yes stop_codon:yes gene_type:complete
MKKRGTLRYKGEEVKKLLPKRIHTKHPVRHISMQEKALSENAQIPVNQKKR